MARVLPALIGAVGLLAGLGVGAAMKLPDASSTRDADSGMTLTAGPGPGQDASTDREAVALDNQFIVPVVVDGRIESLVILTLSIEVAAGGRRVVQSRGPRLRAALLQVLFDHANAGGFSGNFTEPGRLRDLRQALGEAARKVLDGRQAEVLVLDMLRQDN